MGLASLVAAWGSSFASLKLALVSIGPYWVAASRITLAAALLAVIGLFLGVRLPRGRSEWMAVSFIGVIGNSVPFALVGWASLHVASGTAGLMMATVPFLVMIIALAVLPEERVTPARLFGLLMGFAGVVLVIAGRDVAAASAGNSPLGTTIWPYAAMLAAATCYALSSVAGRRFMAIPIMTRTVGALSSASVAAILFAWVVEPFPAAPGLPSLLALLYLAAVPTALATLVLLWLLSHTSAAFASQSSYLVPAAAVLFGAWVYGEHLGWLQYGGMAVIIIGVAIAEAFGRRRGPIPL